jgi:SulP family sulfate permease
MYRFRPQLVDLKRDLLPGQIGRDIAAGIIVGIVALPLAIAFGIASGVTPQQGLVTAIIAGALIAGFGGSRVQIGGPTGAFVVLVAITIERFGLDGLLVATLLAGGMLIVAGLLGAGALIRYIPLPVTTGFTSGIALIIGLGQVADAFGLAVEKVPAAFLPKIQVLTGALGTIDPTALGVTVATLAILLLWPRTGSKVPGPFVALIVTTAAVSLLHLDVATIGSRFGDLPRGLPMPTIPHVSLERLGELFTPAATIALLAAIESLLAAVVADSMTGFRHRANTELVAQGIANLAVPFFGGIPATGAIARTATNIRSGGRTPIAGLVHAATLLIILLVAGPLARLIPMATLAGILLVVAWHMGEWHSFFRLARGPRNDAAVLLTTFGFTVMADLTVGIGMGMALAALLFVQQMTTATQVITGEDDDDSEALVRRAWLPAGVRLLEVRGPLFFGGAETLRRALNVLPDPSKLLLIDLAAAPGLDVTTARILKDFEAQSRSHGTRVVFVTKDAATATALQREGLERALTVERAVGRWKEEGEPETVTSNL